MSKLQIAKRLLIAAGTASVVTTIVGFLPEDLRGLVSMMLILGMVAIWQHHEATRKDRDGQ